MQPLDPEAPATPKMKKRRVKSLGKFSFSLRQLVIFGLVFAGIGGYLIYQAFAYHPVEGLLHPNGSLIQSSGEKEIFLVEDGKRRPVPPEAYETHDFTSKEIRVATEADIKLPVGEPVQLAEGAIVKSKGKIYQIEEHNGTLAKKPIEDSEHLSQLNTREADVTNISSKKLPHDSLPAEKEFSAQDSHPDGTVILSEDGQKYLLENRERRPISSDAVAASHRLDLKKTVAESEGDRALPRGAALHFKEGSLIKGSGDTVYVVEKAKTRIYRVFSGNGYKESLVKRPIRNNEAFRAYSYRESEIIQVSDNELRRLRIGRPLPASVTAPVQVVVTPAAGQDAAALRDDFVANYGAKMRHFFPEWFSMELPLNQAERIKRDPRVKEMAGNVLNAMSVPGAKIANRLPQCEDGKDNDGDGLVDWPADPGCMDGVDDAEYNSSGPSPPPPPEPPSPPPPPPPPPPAGQAPVAQSDPTIGGIAKVGETLVGGTGTWANGVSYYSFKWQRCTNDQPEGYGSGCTDISNGNTQNYLLVEADRSFRIRLVVSASNQYGPGSPAGSKVTQQVASGAAPAPAPAPVPPSPTTPTPIIKGWQFYGGNTWLYSVDLASRCEVRLQGGGIQAFTPSLGGQYTVTAGNGNLAGQLWCWNGSVGPVTSSWAGPSAPAPAPPPPAAQLPVINRWEFNFNNSWTYNVSNANYCEVHLSGYGIQPFTPSLNGAFTVTAGNGSQSGQLKCWNGSVGPAVSGWAGPVAPTQPPSKPTGPKPLPDRYPAITGQAIIGQTLYASSGYWKNGVSSFKYQWYRCVDVDALGYGVDCAAIAGATATSYRLVLGDRGQRMVVKVTATNSYGSTSAGSLATGAVSGFGAASFASEPASPVAKGTVVRLKWYMQYGSNCVASASPANSNWTGPKTVTSPNNGRGSVSVGLINVTTTFYMSCNYPQSVGKTKVALRVVVIDNQQIPPPPPTRPAPTPPPGPQPSVNLTASPGESVASGTEVTLTWNSTNTSGCTASNNQNNPQWTGGKVGSGSQSVGALSATTTFRIDCSSPTGSVSAALTVTVIQGPPPVTPYQQTSPSLARIGIPQGGGANAGSVAVVDTGVERHPLLNVGAGTTFLGGGTNCVANDSSPPTQDDNGHGTMVAGVIGAMGDGINTPRGVAPGTTIIPVKVAGADGNARGDDIACGIKWAVDNRLPTNLSLVGNGGADSGACDRNDGGVNRMICNAAQSGLVVVAAGNDGANVANYWPANVPGVVVATSINDNDGRPGGLGTGPACGDDDRPAAYSNYAEAGFVNRLVAAPACVFTTARGGQYVRVSGTSVAAPIVTAAGGRSSTDPNYMYILPNNGREYGGLVRP